MPQKLLPRRRSLLFLCVCSLLVGVQRSRTISRHLHPEAWVSPRTEAAPSSGRRGAILGAASGLASLAPNDSSALAQTQEAQRQKVSSGQTQLVRKRQLFGTSDGVAIEVARFPESKDSCHGAAKGDFAALNYASAYESIGLQGTPAIYWSEAAVDLLDAPEASKRWTVYDSNNGGNAPFMLPVGDGNILPSFELGLRGMCAGERRIIYVPAALGYGSMGNRIFDVPGNVNLRLDVELLRFESIATTSPWSVPGQLLV